MVYWEAKQEMRTNQWCHFQRKTSRFAKALTETEFKASNCWLSKCNKK